MERELTTQELVEERSFIKSLIETLESVEDPEAEETKEEYERALEIISEKLLQKAERIDYVLLNLEVQENQVDTYIDVLKCEIDKLNKKKQRIKNNVKSINERILPLLVDDNGKLTTKFHKYSIYETAGALEVINPDEIPEEFKKTEVIIKVDNKELRKYIINNGDTAYAKVPKVKRVRRT